LLSVAQERDAIPGKERPRLQNIVKLDPLELDLPRQRQSERAFPHQGTVGTVRSSCGTVFACGSAQSVTSKASVFEPSSDTRPVLLPPPHASVTITALLHPPRRYA